MFSHRFTQLRGKTLAGLLALAALLLGGWVNSLKAQSNYATPYTFTTLPAGFTQPLGIAVDAGGNLYVQNRCAISKITPLGLVTTFAGMAFVPGSSDSTDGTGSTARFNFPTGIALDVAGNLYVADTGNNTIRKITPAGVVTTLAGSPGVSGSSDSTDGTGQTARFNEPIDITVDASGYLYVADDGNDTIRKITPAGVVTTLAGSPGVPGSSDSTDGTGRTARFNYPLGITVDSGGNLYVTDSHNYDIRKITPAGVVTTFAGTAGIAGTSDGTGNAALFYETSGIKVDASGNLYVVEFLYATIRKITSAGVVTTLAGSPGVTGSTNGAGSAALFNQPWGIAIDANGILYVADTENGSIRKGTPPVTLPTATIVAASNITATSAQLNGMVNAFNGNTTVVFQYGTDPNFSPGLTTTVTATQGTISSGIPTPVSAMVTGLTDGTTYYYQFNATNSVGTTVSGVGSFIPFTSPSATIGAATTESTTSVQVSGTYNAQGISTQVYFRYGTDPTMTAYSNILASPTTATGYANTTATAVLPNLVQGTTYYYQLTNLAGTVTSGIGSFQTQLLSGLQRQFPSAPPSSNGLVIVNLTPTTITPSPGWNFVGEQLWRPSGVPVTGLVTGTYNIEYQPAPGYIQPPPETISVTSGGGAYTLITREYLPTPAAATGVLDVVLQPTNLANTAWSFYGQSQSYAGGTTISGLAPGNYLIQCASVDGYTTPPPTSVTVLPSITSTQVVTLTYYAANTSTSGVVPQVLPFSTVTDQTMPDMPYAFVGQIRNDLGSATGFVVENRVVATAGHVVYDAGSMSYVTGLQWLFQRYAGTYEPVPQIPQGVYVMSGYAAQRATDPNPAISSPTSQNLDVAALYFLSSAGGSGGGYSGYLASDSSPNEFLTSSNNKILVGYPVDGEPAANQGQMWATTPVTGTFTQDSGKDTSTGNLTSGTNLQVYYTTALTSVGGNSGGPLCVQYNGSNTQYDGIYYPAAIYLGGSGNQTSVRAIDSNVIALFNNAEIGATAGTNNLSAGITQFNSGTVNTSPFASSSIQVYFAPAAATGAHWALSATDLAPGYYNNNGAVINGEGVGVHELYVTPVAGFATPPTYYPITLTGGQLSIVTVTYQTLATQPQSVTFTSATTIPIVTSSYSISGASLNFTLSYAPTPGTVLTVIQNTGGSAISGTFTNLPNNGTITATYNGATYTFTANYSGGTSGDNLTLTLTSIANPTDTPLLPPWALALLAMLLFIASTRHIRELPIKKSLSS